MKECVNKIVPIRMSPYDELLGADLVEHHIRHGQVGISRALSALRPHHEDDVGIDTIKNVGSNPGHEKYIHDTYLYPSTDDNPTQQVISTITNSAKERQKNEKNNKTTSKKKNRVSAKNNNNNKDLSLTALDAIGDNEIPKYAWID